MGACRVPAGRTELPLDVTSSVAVASTGGDAPGIEALKITVPGFGGAVKGIENDPSLLVVTVLGGVVTPPAVAVSCTLIPEAGLSSGFRTLPEIVHGSPATVVTGESKMVSKTGELPSIAAPGALASQNP